jgi:hypothetical protein
MTSEERISYAKSSVENISKFDAKMTIDAYMSIYTQVLACYQNNTKYNSKVQSAHK